MGGKNGMAIILRSVRSKQKSEVYSSVASGMCWIDSAIQIHNSDPKHPQWTAMSHELTLHAWGWGVLLIRWSGEPRKERFKFQNWLRDHRACPLGCLKAEPIYQFNLIILIYLCYVVQLWLCFDVGCALLCSGQIFELLVAGNLKLKEFIRFIIIHSFIHQSSFVIHHSSFIHSSFFFRISGFLQIRLRFFYGAGLQRLPKSDPQSQPQSSQKKNIQFC